MFQNKKINVASNKGGKMKFIIGYTPRWLVKIKGTRPLIYAPLPYLLLLDYQYAHDW